MGRTGPVGAYGCPEPKLIQEATGAKNAGIQFSNIECHCYGCIEYNYWSAEAELF
jgi:hypothetical protein